MASRGGRSRARRAPVRPAPRARVARRARAPPPRELRLPDFRATPLRVLIDRPTLAAGLLLALPVLLYLWPVLLGGRMLTPLPALYVFVPWSASPPRNFHSWFNFLLIDPAVADYPWRAFARGLIRDGVLPAWNPHVFAGAPFLSNPQTGVFSLFSLPLWVLPLGYAVGVGAALKLWAGAFGCYLLVRQLRLGFLPGLLAGVAFAFSALNIVWLTHETLPAVAALLPWMVLFVERLFEHGRWGDAIGLALATAIGLGGGHPGMQVHLMAAAGMYALLRAAFARDGASRLRPLALGGAGLLAGVLLMGVMLVPELLSSRGTIGTLARHGGRGSLPGTYMPFEAIKTVVFPDWWGRGSGFELEPRGIPNFNERTFYPGIVALLLGCVGLLAPDRWRRKAPFLVLGVLGLAIPLHAPGLYWLVVHLPAFQDVQNQRMHFVFAFAVAILAAFGLQALLERPAERRWLAIPAAAVFIGLLGLTGAGGKPGDAGRLLRHFATGVDYHRASILALTTVTWFLLFAVGVGLALLAARRWTPWAAVIAAVLVALAVGDAMHFAHGYQPMPPRSKAIPPATPAVAYLQRHRDEGRFVGLEHILANDWSLVYGLDDVRGYDPPQPTVRFYHLWLAAEPGQTNWQTFQVESLEPRALRVMSVLGARYVISYPGSIYERDAMPALRAPTKVYSGRDATIFRNDNAVPRALIARRIRLTTEEGTTLGTIVERRFDPRAEVAVERREPGVASLRGAPPRGSVRVAGEENARVTLRASLDRRGLVVLNDNLADGWTVAVDGREAPVVRVNSVMRGVIVGAGRHEIVWSYAVPGLRLGLALSVLTLALLLGGGTALALRRRRAQAAEAALAER